MTVHQRHRSVMFSATHVIRRLGGSASTQELHNAGFDKWAIRVAVSDGSILRIRRGWYAEAGLHPDVLRASRVGGRLGCQSALAFHGVWVKLDADIHVTVDPTACRLRSPDDASHRLSETSRVKVHWHAVVSRSRLVVDELTALSEMCSCSTPELVAASADSLLRRSPTLRSAVRAVASASPARFRRALDGADGICESGIETIFWNRMRALAPRRQVSIPGIGRVDFLFGDRLVVEVDGKEFHTQTPHFESDRRRDAALSALGYRVLRFSYRQVMFDWPSVEAAIWAAIARGDRH
jgi:very-short-patch-repair endonuclease